MDRQQVKAVCERSVESAGAAPVAAPAVAVAGGGAGDSGAASATVSSASELRDGPRQQPSPPPPPPPRRELRSCTECGRRKIRCDKQRPCSACTNRGEPELCHSGTYTRLRTDRKSYATVEQLNQLQLKLDRLESALAHRIQLNLHSTSFPTPPSSFFPSYPTASRQPLLPADCHLSLLSELCTASASATASSTSTSTLPPSHHYHPRSALADNATLDPELATDAAAAGAGQAEPESASLGQLSSSIRRAALDHTCWADPSAAAEHVTSSSSSSSLHAAFLARLLVLFPRRHIANALIDAFFALPDVLLNHIIDRDELHTAVDGLYHDLLQRRRPSKSPAFIALLLAVFAAGLHAADPQVPEQRAALEACGWVAQAHHPSAATASLLNLNQSFFNVRVAGLTGFAHGDGPGGQVRLTIPFTVRAWQESCLKALHLADFLAQPSFPALAALQVMGCVCLEPTQAARRDSLAAIAFAIARRLNLHRNNSSSSSESRDSDPCSGNGNRLICVMALQECQAALAHPDRNGFVAWPYTVPLGNAAVGSYDSVMARLVTLSQHVCQTVFQHSNKSQDLDELPAGVATRLCAEMDVYHQRLPRDFMLTDTHVEACAAGIGDATSRHGLVGAQELDRMLLHIHLAALRVLVLIRIPFVRRFSTRGVAHDALRADLHTTALRHLTLSAKACTLSPALLKFGNNGLLLLRSALALVLDVQLGWIEATLRPRVVCALGWVCDQLSALKAHGAQVGRLKWLIDEVLLCGSQSNVNADAVSAQDRLDQLLSQLVASSTPTPDADERAAWSNFVDPETLDTVASVANYENNGDQCAQEAFHVLRIEPDCTVLLQDSNLATTATCTEAEAQSNLIRTNSDEVDSTSRPQRQQQPQHQQQRQKTIPAADAASLLSAQPSQSRASMGANVPTSSFQNVPADLVSSQPLPPPTFGNAGAQDADVPQWVSSLLEAVLNGVA